MQPTDRIVFVQEIKNQTKATGYIASKEYSTYKVTAVGKEVSLCKKGDFILFDVGQRGVYEYKGENIIGIKEDEIVGVHSNA